MGISFVEKYEILSDNELASKSQEGDGEASVALLRRHMGLIKNRAAAFYNGSIEMEDLMQEGIIALYQCIKSFDSAEASFPTFARLCVDRALMSEIRAISRKKRIPKDKLVSLEDVSVMADGSDPERMLIETEEVSDLNVNLQRLLSKLEYKVLMLYLHNYSVADIAEALSVSEKSVNNALYRIRNKLTNL
ncbi:MAG: sigma-70 family RNA polymerase sigma factor [Clostridia bacterium]|nr:sigma-70 family RNA polymerase sigma factor [Clostridia bacterium]